MGDRKVILEFQGWPTRLLPGTEQPCAGGSRPACPHSCHPDMSAATAQKALCFALTRPWVGAHAVEQRDPLWAPEITRNPESAWVNPASGCLLMLALDQGESLGTGM